MRTVIERSLIRIIEAALRDKKRNPLRSGPTEFGLRLGLTSSIFELRWSHDTWLSIPELLRHQATVGATGTGKSVGSLGQSMQIPRSGIAEIKIDSHDTIAKQLRLIARGIVTKRLDERVLDDLLLVSFGCRHWSVRMAPLYCSSPERAPEPVGLMLNWINAMYPGGLGAQTYQFAHAIFTLLAERGIPLSDIVKLLADPMRVRGHASKLVNARAREYFLLQFLTWSPRRQAQVAEALINKIVVLLSDPRIDTALSSPQGDIDFRRAMDEGKTILIEIGRAEFFDSVKWLAGMQLVAIQQAVFSRADIPEGKRRPVILTIEEFPTLAEAATIVPLLAEGRKFGIGLNLVTQTFASLEKPLLSSLRANCLTQVLFRLSPEDAQLAVSGLSGEVRNLVYQHLVSLPVGRAVLLQGDTPPRLLRFDNVDIPESLTRDEEDVIEHIRRNVGRPLKANHPVREHVTVAQPPAPELLASSPSTVSHTTPDFVEGDLL